MQNPSIEQLIALAQSGDADAFGQLYTRFKRRVKAYLADAHAEDILQDTFLSAWAAIQTYDPAKGKFITWLYKIAQNERAKYYRQQNTCARKRRGQPRQHYTEVSLEKMLDERLGQDDESPDYQGADLLDGPEDSLTDREATNEVTRDLLAEIYHDEEACEALYRKVIERKRLAQSAREEGVKASTLRSQVHRAKRRLRAKYQDH